MFKSTVVLTLLAFTLIACEDPDLDNEQAAEEEAEEEVEELEEVIEKAEEESEPMDYGDDRHFDKLWDECEDGDQDACEELYWDSPVGSEYEAFAQRHRGSGASIDDADIADLAFVTIVRANVASLANADDETLIDLGHVTCETLDAIDPSSMEDVAFAAVAGGVPLEEGEAYGFVFGAAAAAYCPRWTHIFE